MRISTRHSVAVALVSLALLGTTDVRAETSDSRTMLKNEKEAGSYKADDTGRNARDVNAGRLTADQQSMAGGDETALLARIREDVVSDDSFSTYAKNVKIMVENGSVTLRGPVVTEAEKTSIARIAERDASGYKVINQLEVAPR